MSPQHQFLKPVLRHFVIILIIVPALFLVNAYLTLPSFLPQLKRQPFLMETFFLPTEATVLALPEYKEAVVITKGALSLYSIDQQRKAFCRLATLPFESSSGLAVVDKKRLKLYLLNENELQVLDISDPQNVQRQNLLHFKEPFEVENLSLSVDGKILYITAEKSLYLVKIFPEGHAKIVKKVPDWRHRFTWEVASGILYTYEEGNIDIYKMNNDRSPILYSSYVTSLDRAEALFSDDRKRLFLFRDKAVEIINTENRMNPQPFGMLQLKDPVVAVLQESNLSDLLIATPRDILIYHITVPTEPILSAKVSYKKK